MKHIMYQVKEQRNLNSLTEAATQTMRTMNIRAMERHICLPTQHKYRRQKENKIALDKTIKTCVQKRRIKVSIIIDHLVELD
jgi:hypothetical protein